MEEGLCDGRVLFHKYQQRSQVGGGWDLPACASWSVPQLLLNKSRQHSKGASKACRRGQRAWFCASAANSTQACNRSYHATTPPARVQEEAAAQQADFDAKEALREKRRKEQVGRCVENWGAVCVG